jgi:hypothetical protein
MTNMWAIRLSGWTNFKLVPEGRLEAYIISVIPDKKSEITIYISKQEVYND